MFDSGPGIHSWNMAMDEALLESMPRLGLPVLRFYGWTEPAASFGYFQHYAEVESLTPLRPLVRRPTGGGIVPHDRDWTYSVAVPPSHPWYALTAVESYRHIHAWLQAAFARLNVETEVAPHPLKTAAGQCFVGYEQSDLLWRERKIAGAAQRRRRDGLLIQGSVQPPPVPVTRGEWQRAMVAAASATQGITWANLDPDPPLLTRVQELIERKYSLASYNQRR